MSIRGMRWAAVSLVALVAACGAEADQAPPPAPEVGVVEIQPQPYDMTIELSGRVTAFETSEVRPQIGGIVRARRFTEGAQVRAGQVLYDIDVGPASSDAAAANAAAASAQARFERYQQLVEINAVSRQELDDARAAANQANAAAQSARINLGYTSVRAPISGIIGASSVTPGALATPSQVQPFAVIQSIDQVYVDMTQSSADLMRLRQALQEQGVNTDRITVRLMLPTGEEYAHTGVLQFSGASVNPATGAVTLRALFPNPNHTLLPGMFVDARVSQGTVPNAILAPQQAVSRNARGEAVVMVLNGENVVEERVLETDQTNGANWVVTAGLNPGDRVIVEGVQRVRPGVEARAAAPTVRDAAAEHQQGIRGRQQGG
jgi:membrane fusion protein, multidrug efflux system